MRPALWLLALFLAAAPAAAAPASAPDAPSASLAVCKAIVDNRCEGAAITFPSDVGKLYGFSEAVNVPDELVHVWFYKDKELGSLTMKAPKGSPTRWLTWSNVTVSKNMAGPWRLEARDAEGHVLASVTFTVE